MERYSSYKDSGISWIGMIPEHWETKQLRSFLTLFTEKGHGDAQLLSVTREQGVIVRDKDDKDENHNFVPDDLSGYKYIEKGDFAINKMKAWQGSYAVSDYCGIVSPAYYTCKLKGVNKNFFSKAIRSKAYVPFFTQYSKGIRVGQWDLNPNALKSIPFILPPINEQQSIVAFIEEKCQKIDMYVAEKEKEIQLLQELKQKTIADAVTKGLNPDVKLKDSGISWIGMIPEHWEIRRLSQVSYEHYLSNREVHHQNLLSLSYGRIIRKDINTTEGLLPASFDTYQIVEEGNIVMRLTDLQNDHKSLRVGLVNEEGIVTSAYVCLGVFSSVVPAFLYYVLHSYDIKKLFYSMGGGLRQNLNWQGLKKLDLPLPSKAEQQAIVTYIKEKCQKIDTLVTELQAEIDYMNEYKQRLIADCVTGQVKV